MRTQGRNEGATKQMSRRIVLPHLTTVPAGQQLPLLSCSEYRAGRIGCPPILAVSQVGAGEKTSFALPLFSQGEK